MAAELHSATEAMQRAAEAMIAATESFRRQFQQPEGGPQRPVTYHPYRQPAEVNASAPESVSSSPRRGRPTSLPAPAPTAALGGRAQQLPTRSQAPSLADFLPQLPEGQRPSSDTFVSSAANGQQQQQEPVPPRESSEAIVSMTPTSEWPAITGSVPDLASTIAPPSVKTGPGVGARRGPASIDLVDAVRGFGRTPSRQGAYELDGGPNEASPVVHIGRYRYIRSDLEEHRQSLIRDTPAKQGPPAGLSLGREILFVLVISLAQMLMLSGMAQALVPAKIIGQTFPDTNPGHIAWYSASYGLTAGTFVLPSGRLGDLFGHKKIFIIGFIWFGVWSFAAGFAELVERGGFGGTIYFIFCRAMQGIGPALLVPNGQAMLGRAYKPGPRKNLVFCLFSAAAPLGFVVGGTMAALFAMEASWPWAFWTMSAVCIALAAVSVPVLPRAEQTNRNSEESMWVQLDAVGIFFGVSGLVLFNFAFNQAPIVQWTTPYAYFLLIIGVLFLCAFVYTELVAPHPLVPIHAMKATSNFVLGCTGAGWGCFAVWIFYAIAMFENLRGWSPLLVSAATAHAPLFGLIASILTGFMMSRTKPHWVMLASMAAFFVGSLLLATAPVEQNYWFNTFWSILIMPFGMDMSNPAAVILLSNAVGKEHQGIAASLVVTTVNYSISLALGFAGTIETHVNAGGSDLLAGYRGAQYFGIGLGGLGVLLATAFLMLSYARPPPSSQPEKVG
jgi:MFS family permease